MAYSPQAGYGMSQSMGNTSGQGEQAIIPPEIEGLNWGAFLLSWIWGLGNGVLIALLSLIIPFFPIYLLIKGNELAWRSKQWASVEEFKATQAKWTRWGVILFVAGLVLSCLMFVFIFIIAAAASTST